MLYTDYVDALLEQAEGFRVDTFADVTHGDRAYPLLVLTRPGPRTLLVTAGFHGDEPAGPMTLLNHLPEVRRLADEWGVGLRIYPSLNPTGFEDGSRYNRFGERPNNDFLRYQLDSGAWLGELRPGQTATRWEDVDAAARETRALRDELTALPPPDAALDLHQDRYTPGAWHYAYSFGDPQSYAPMVQASTPHAPPLANQMVDSGYDEHVGIRSDGLGLIEFHDGSITDWLWRRGVRHTAALETTTDTPPTVCDQINLAWIEGFIELAARS